MFSIVVYRKFYHKEGRMLNEHAALLFSESVISQPLFYAFGRRIVKTVPSSGVDAAAIVP